MSTPAKKLIEVALPLEEINLASAREKSIRHGHPSTLHLWWARRPLAAARAVIFAQLVDDPSAYVEELRTQPELVHAAERKLGRKIKPGEVHPVIDEILVGLERQRLFDLIARKVNTGQIDKKTGEPVYRIDGLVAWPGDDERLKTAWEQDLETARQEIRTSWRRQCRRDGQPEDTPLPAFHDPFAGGGALPLEAQRLGLESYASDLNPVAVLINKAMIEIPPKFAGRPPVNPDWQRNSSGEKALAQWKGAQGLAADVRYYGQWMRDEAEKRIGHLYPEVEITAAMAEERPDLRPLVGRKLTVIAWLWARTVKSPNPAFSQVDVPLVSTFLLSTKTGKEVYVEPVLENGGYRFAVRIGKPENAEAAKNGTKLSRGANFRCVMSDTPIAPDHIYSEANAGRMGSRLMAIVAEGDRGRIYLQPQSEHEEVIRKAAPAWKPDVLMPENPRWFSPPLYGLKSYGDLFTARQLVALTTFSDLVGEARERIRVDALAAGLPDTAEGLDAGGFGSKAYSEAIGVYLACAIGRSVDYWNVNATWETAGGFIAHLFTRNSIPMVWDFAEANPFSDSSGNWPSTCLEWVVKVLELFTAPATGLVAMADAQTQKISEGKCISTDPPYYDNIGYADLSDFFYVWIRKTLRETFPQLLATVAVPKAEELVATPYRHGSKQKAESFFLNGMTDAMRSLARQAHSSAPVTIYYAFKQSEKETDIGVSSTGWETFLEAIVQAGFGVSGTWPMRTERGARSIGIGTNALASSIVLVCRRRAEDLHPATRREFVSALQREMPGALRDLQQGNLAPVDLPQSSIGPGMAIFTRYAQVIEADGNPMTVRTALQLMNAAVTEFLTGQESEMDEWTRFAVTWFSQFGYKQGAFGDALNIANAYAVSVEGVVEAGILESGAGKVRILQPTELDASWDPATDPRLTVWEIVHHLIRLLDQQGEAAAAKILAKAGTKAEEARSLCYRLYTVCEQKKWAEEARQYNTLIVSWPELVRLAADPGSVAQETQGELQM